MTFKNNSSDFPALLLGPAAARSLTTGLLVWVITGCASVYEGKYDWKEGWRQGKIMQIGSASELGEPQFSDCRGKVSAQQLASDKFASVSYLHMTRERRRVVPVQQGHPFRPGDDVYVSIASCTAPLVRQSAGVQQALHV